MRWIVFLSFVEFCLFVFRLHVFCCSFFCSFSCLSFGHVRVKAFSKHVCSPLFCHMDVCKCGLLSAHAYSAAFGSCSPQCLMRFNSKLFCTHTHTAMHTHVYIHWRKHYIKVSPFNDGMWAIQWIFTTQYRSVYNGKF